MHWGRVLPFTFIIGMLALMGCSLSNLGRAFKKNKTPQTEQSAVKKKRPLHATSDTLEPGTEGSIHIESIVDTIDNWQNYDFDNIPIYNNATSNSELTELQETEDEEENMDSTLSVANNQDSITHERPTRAISQGSRFVRRKVDIENKVVFAAKDSMIMLRQDSAFMYGNGSVQYGQIKLNAAQIEMDIKDNSVYAIGRPDTLGEIQGRPVFAEGGTDYTAKSMNYNFKTRKGLIKDVVTQQGEGYLHSGLTKKVDDKTFYFQDGKYTTCDDPECPHFYFQITRGRMEPGKNVVTGPRIWSWRGYLCLLHFPLDISPLAKVINLEFLSPHLVKIIIEVFILAMVVIILR